MARWFFNTHAYLELEAERLGGVPSVLYESEGYCAGFVRRSILGTEYYDGTSVYGVPSNTFGAISAEDGKHELITSIDKLRDRRAVVSLFMRGGVGDQMPALHPNLGKVEHIGDSVVVSLLQDAELIFAGFRKNLRNELRNGERFEVTECDDVAGFHKVYTESMVRASARSDYFFSLNYLERLFAIPGARLFSIRDGRELLCSAFVVEQYPYLVYHLSGTASNALHRSPMRSLLAHVSMTFNQQEWIGFALGGGVGGRGDSLLRFKRGFSKETAPVNSLKVVTDPHAYETLAGNDAGAADRLEGFFPHYRKPKH